MKFTEFGFSQNIIKALEALGFETATEVQQKAIPLIMEGKNLVVRSQTGSGKTFAFGLPLLENTSKDIIFPETLIICPTRELTLQVCDEIKKITGYMENVKVVPIYGGSNITRQVQALKRKPQIIVGTPGRILDHIDRKTLKLHYLKNVVLDEADEMLNMGFKEDIEQILKGTPENKRTLLFSATYPERIKQIVQEYMPEHERIEIGSENKSLKNIYQQYVLVNKQDKTDALVALLEDKRDKHILIFCNTKAMTEKIANTLNLSGFEAHSLHGDLKQSQRKIVTSDFKFKKVSVLVASDVAARGLDINDIDFVINYDIPSNLEYFLHRMGRTARAGKNGNAVTIVTSKNQLGDLKVFERQTDSNITELKLAQFSYDSAQDTSTSGKAKSSRGGSRNSRGPRSSEPRRERSSEGRGFGSKSSAPRRERSSEPRRERSSEGRAPRSSESRNERGFEGRRERSSEPRRERSSEGRSFGSRSSEGRAPRNFEGRGERNFESRNPRSSEGRRERSSEGRGFGSRNFSSKEGFSSRKPAFERRERSEGLEKSSGKGFRNKSTRAEKDFVVSEKVFDKVKRKKEILTGKSFDQTSSERGFEKKSDSRSFGKKPGAKSFGSKKEFGSDKKGFKAGRSSGRSAPKSFNKKEGGFGKRSSKPSFKK